MVFGKANRVILLVSFRVFNLNNNPILFFHVFFRTARTIRIGYFLRYIKDKI